MNNCPNCGAPESVMTGAHLCRCTISEKLRAEKILRRQEREDLKRRGKRVLVDDTGAGADRYRRD